MSVGFVQTYRAFAYNNAWANHRLLGACAELSQAEFEAERAGFFPSLQKTLNHIHVIDLFYVDALEGGWLGPRAWSNAVPYPDVAGIQRAQARTAEPHRAGPSREPRPERTLRPPSDASVPARHPPSRTGARDAVGYGRRPAAARRIFRDRRGAAEAAEFADLGWTEGMVWDDKT